MIEELEKENLSILDHSFVDKEYVEKEFSVNPYAHFIILKEYDEIIGYLYYSDIFERAEINQIEIDSFHRNCGNGTKLMEYFTNLVDKNITLEVKKDNEAAIKLYEKFGFEKKAIREGYYNGVDGILMERKKDS